MLKKTLCIVVLWAVCFNNRASSQNLVPNPSFEEYNELPCGTSFIPDVFNNAIKHWSTPNQGTPDFYSELVDIDCGNNPLGQTQQGSGTQKPEDGLSMVGLITFTERNTGSCHDYSEYIQVQLKEPLNKGSTYFCGFYLSLGDYREYASNNIGMLFTKNPVGSDSCIYLSNNPQFNVESIVTDNENWVFINGSFIADNTSQYLTIGNFFSDETTQTVYIHNNPVFNSGLAYYFIDSVFVEPVLDLNIPNVITPNSDAYNQQFRINGLQSDRWILNIYDRWGQIVFRSNSYKNDWEGAGLAAGVYYYHIKHRYINKVYKGNVFIIK